MQRSDAELQQLRCSVCEGPFEGLLDDWQLTCQEREAVEWERLVAWKEEEEEGSATFDSFDATVCPGAHNLKWVKADGEYSCDRCGIDIHSSQRMHCCRRCDYVACKTCFNET